MLYNTIYNNPTNYEFVVFRDLVSFCQMNIYYDAKIAFYVKINKILHNIISYY